LLLLLLAAAALSASRAVPEGVGAPVAMASAALREVDIDDAIARRGCTAAFEAVQMCLADTGRDWGKVRAPGRGAVAAQR